jgi:Kef-type K+ transport system membrane component KefB
MAYLGMNPGLPWIVVFALFFVTSSSRLIVSQTTNTRIPRPNERAGFQSLSSAIQAGTMGLSALSTRYVLGSTPEGKLTGIAPFALGVIVVGWIYPFLVYRLNALLARRDLEEAAMEAVPAE